MGVRVVNRERIDVMIIITLEQVASHQNIEQKCFMPLCKEHLRLQAAHGREGEDFVPPFDLCLLLL